MNYFNNQTTRDYLKFRHHRPPVEKVFSEKAVRVGTFLGGPLVAGYLMAENFKVFNEKAKAKKAWIISIVSSIVIFGVIFLIPFFAKVPNSIIPLANTAIVSICVKITFLHAYFLNHIGHRGEISMFSLCLVFQ